MRSGAAVFYRMEISPMVRVADILIYGGTCAFVAGCGCTVAWLCGDAMIGVGVSVVIAGAAAVVLGIALAVLKGFQHD